MHGGGVGSAAILVALVALAVRWLWLLGHAVHVERCRELFRLPRERFEEQLLKAAAFTGLPRGLKWVKCAITGDAVLVRDTATGNIVAPFRCKSISFRWKGATWKACRRARTTPGDGGIQL